MSNTSKSSKRNGNKVKQWFITFPRWEDVPNWESILPSSKYGLATQEHHEDGGLHWHIIIQLKVGLTKPSLLAFFTKTYPNDWKRIHFEPIRDIGHARNYVKKDIVLQQEWGTLLYLSPEMQLLKDEWTNTKLTADVATLNARQHQRHCEHIAYLWEQEHPACLYCGSRVIFCCDYYPTINIDL